MKLTNAAVYIQLANLERSDYTIHQFSIPYTFVKILLLKQKLEEIDLYSSVIYN